MASARGIRAGAAFIELGLDDSKLQSKLRTAGAKLKAFGAGVAKLGGMFAAAGAAGVAAFAGMLKTFASVGDGLDKMAARTGFAVETLSALGFAAGQSGGSIESLGKAVKKMSLFVLGASQGLLTQIDTLDELGLSVSAVQGLSPEETFKVFANAIAGVEDPLTRAALASKVFGGAGIDLLPMLSQGSEGMEALIKEAEGLGIVMDRDTATAAAAVTDAMGRMVAQVKMAVVQIGGALAPAFLTFGKVVSGTLSDLLEWIKGNQALVVTVATVTGVVGVAGIALTVFGTIINIVGAAVGGLAVAFGVLRTATLAATAAMSANPIIAIGVVLATVIVAFGAAAAASDGFFNSITDGVGPAIGALKKLRNEIAAGVDVSKQRQLAAVKAALAEEQVTFAEIGVPEFEGFLGEFRKKLREQADRAQRIDDLTAEISALEKPDAGPLKAGSQLTPTPAAPTSLAEALAANLKPEGPEAGPLKAGTQFEVPKQSLDGLAAGLAATLKDKVAGLGESVRSSSTFGSFDPAQLARLAGPQTVEKEILTETETQTEVLREIARNVGQRKFA